MIDADTPDAQATVLPASGTPAPRLLRTAGLVAVITALGSVLGLLRDVLLARFFGASGETDAFLVAWTVPETATPLLMEGAMALLLVPLMSRELELRGSVNRLVARTFLPVLGLLALLSASAAIFAPVIVRALTPGIEDVGLAVRCFRAASLTVLFLGTSGYSMAVLRANGQFFVPACVYVAYNVGILALVVPLHSRYGVFIAAVGLSVGSALMVLIQIPAFLRRVSLKVARLRVDRALVVAAAAYFPLGLYMAGRQAQVYVERFLGSGLDAGTISQLNYASKVAQIPVVMVTTVAMVSLPTLSRDAAAERLAEYRRGIERNLRLGAFLVLPAMALLVAFAPEIIHVLFERGAFTTHDTASCAAIMRVYTLGLLGQVLVAFAVVCFFSRGRRTWYPGVCAVTCLAVTILVSASSVSTLGARGLALGNAAGITVAGGMLLAGLRRRVAPIDMRKFLGTVLRCVLAAAAACLVGVLLGGELIDLPSLVVLLISTPVVLTTYIVGCSLLGVGEMAEVLSSIRRRLGHTTEAAGATMPTEASPAPVTDDPSPDPLTPTHISASVTAVEASTEGAPLRRSSARRVQSSACARPEVLIADEGLKCGRTALAAVRALAQAGYAPTVTVSNGATLASRSRHTARVLRVPPSNVPGWATAIEQELADRHYLAVFPTSDVALQALGAPGMELVDKRELANAAAKAGMPMPSVLTFDSIAAMRTAEGQLPLPMALKTALSTPGATDLAMRINTQADLDALPDVPGAVVVQPYLKGPMRAVSGVVREGRLIAVVHQEYLRIWRPDAGVACAARTVEPDRQLEARLTQLLENFEGIFQAQLIDGNLIDVNPRVYGSLPLAVAAGVNLPALWCRALAGEVFESTLRARPGIYYRWLDADLRAIAKGIGSGSMDIGQATRALLPRRGTVHSIEDRRDVRPFLTRVGDLTWRR